ncbi:MAG: hypothetical protein AB1546_01005 [bacterium]
MAIAAAEVLERFKENMELFNYDDVIMLEELVNEFNAELVIMSIDCSLILNELKKYKSKVETAQLQGTYQQIAPWVYEVLYNFSIRGFIVQYPSFLFRGRKIFTRLETALVLVDLIDELRENRERFNQDDINDIKRLVTEFNREINDINYYYKDVLEDVGLMKKPEEIKRDVFDIKGRVNPRIYKKEGEDTDFSNRLDVDSEFGFFTSSFISSVEEKGDSGAYEFEMDVWALKYNDSSNGDNSEFDIEAGNAVNIDYGSGLVAGSARVKGIKLTIKGIQKYNIYGFGGEMTDGEKLTGIRLENELSDSFIFGISGVRIQTPNAGSSDVKGLDFESDGRKLKLAGEYSAKDDGRGFYFNSLYKISQSLELRNDYRNYYNLRLESNNPQVYSGKSGGDENDEIGHLIGLNWIITDNYSLFASRDFYKNHNDLEKSINYFIRIRTILKKNQQLMLSFEDENGNDLKSKRKTLHFIQQSPRKLVYQFSFTRDSGADRTITIRNQLRFPLFREDLIANLSDIYRITGKDSGNTIQIQVNWNISEKTNLLIGFAVPESEDSSFNTNMNIKF